MKGLEPSRRKALAPKASVSTNSTTSARGQKLIVNSRSTRVHVVTIPDMNVEQKIKAATIYGLKSGAYAII